MLGSDFALRSPSRENAVAVTSLARDHTVRQVQGSRDTRMPQVIAELL